MTEDYVEARKRYVQEIRSSFPKEDTGRAAVHARLHADVIEEHADNLETVGAGALFKVKLLLAAMLFVVFVLCDRTNTKLFSMSTDTIVEKIGQNQKLPKQVNETVKEVLSAIN